MPVPPDVVELVRQFANNSFRFLFRHPANAAELLRWREPGLASRIEFASMTASPETFVAADFSVLESDVILRVPFRVRKGPGGRIEVFVLIENQSEPDERMLFRSIRYVMSIYKRQAALWSRKHGNLRGFAFDPVWPLVFYSGTRTWEKPRPISDLVREGDLFGKRIPSIEVDFIDLAKTCEEVLRNEVGTLGWVLWLVQQRRCKSKEFRGVLEQVVQQVDGLPEGERERWGQLLWFAHALVYHARVGDERRAMADIIRQTVRQSHRPEVSVMGKTIYETVLEEGMEKGLLQGALE